jgi:thymidylate synthase
MSGVEAAGFVLGSFSLVLSAIEHYRNAIDATRGNKQLNSLQNEVKTQYVILKNNITNLLSPLIDDRTRKALEDHNSALWRDPLIESALKNSLGQSYDVFLQLVWRMIPLLRNLVNEIDKIRNLSLYLLTNSYCVDK